MPLRMDHYASGPPRSRSRCAHRSRRNPDQITGSVVQRADTLRGADHDVFDAGTEAPGDVETWFHAECHARLEGQIIALDEVRLLVTVKPDAVADPVDEVVNQRRLLQRRRCHHIASLAIDRLAGTPRSNE